MVKPFGPYVSGQPLYMRDDFIDGLKCLRSDDYEGALLLFRAADECAEIDDIYQSRYTSFHGLSRVYMGDSSGVKLCRKAVVGEIRDAEVYYNLAMAEHRLNFHESALTALRRGMNVDPHHAGLLRLQRVLSPKSRLGAGANGLVKQLLGRLLGHSV